MIERSYWGGKTRRGALFMVAGINVGHDTIERIMKKAYELAGRTNIQTYGYLIDKKYIEIFKKYNAVLVLALMDLGH